MPNRVDVYERLRRQIDKMPVGMPKSEKGEEIRILKHLFSPDEAGIALHLNMVLEPVGKIHKRLIKSANNMTIEALERTLDSLADKGAILADKKYGEKRFGLAQFVVGMFELQVDRMTPDFARDSFAYTGGAFANELHRTKIPQLRAVPVNKSVVNELHISTYDNIRELVRNTEGGFGLMNCICKQRKDLTGDKCKVTDIRETCITFPHVTPMFRRLSANRPVDRDEIYDILDRGEKEGLVIQIGNTQVPMVVCCCCGDCCEILVSAKKFPKPAELFTTNYYAQIRKGDCTECGICASRCQMGAPVISDPDPHIDLTRCIGCGLCVSACPNNAVVMIKKRNQTVPPRNEKSLYAKILFRKGGFLKLLKTGVRLFLGKQM